ncbi:MAG: TIGR00304 family protein, partial [Thermoplasmatales archaeon]|nr:TIGR00304 family protein [Thermoplasmatales archaeon]
IVGSGVYAFLGFISMFIAIILFMIGFSSKFPLGDLNRYKENANQTRKETSVKSGGVILIGPIPIVFGSNWKIAIIMLILAIVLIIASFFVFKTI